MKYLFLILILSGCTYIPIVNEALTVAIDIQTKNYCDNTSEAKKARRLILIRIKNPDYISVCD